jgi:hypothetical protein
MVKVSEEEKRRERREKRGLAVLSVKVILLFD